MPDVHTSRLCAQIFHSHFGPLTAKVASALLTRGRLTLPQLIRYTKLRPRAVRASLLILIQHNLAYHDLSEVDGGEVFEVNILQCLIRLRFGKFVCQAEQVFGQSAAEIVQLILDHGKLRVPDIITQLSAGDSKRIKLLTQAMHQLVSNSFLTPSTVLSHISPQDKLLKYEAEEVVKISGLPTAKQLREAKEMAAARLRREEGEEESAGMLESTNGSMKFSKNKSREEVNPEVYFRVNYNRFHLLLRNELIESLARERFNEAAGVLLHAAVKATEDKTMKISDTRSVPTSIANICMQLPDDYDLSTGLITSSSKKIPQAVLAKEYIGVLSAADNPTAEGRESSFVTLSSSKVYVEFEMICRRLRRRVLEAMIREWHGQQGVRLVRLLLSTGKLEEKQISKMALMAMKDVRSLLAAMSNDMLVSIQEVPKTADRAPSRTFYLWYVDLEKAYSAVLSKLYKTLYNISVRYSAELQDPELKAVLEKRQRTDISSDESLLTRMEREAIQRWEDKRDRLTVLQARVDETVFILRELAVFGTQD